MQKPLRHAFILIQGLEGVSAIMRGLQKIRNEAQLPLSMVSPERQSDLSHGR